MQLTLEQLVTCCPISNDKLALLAALNTILPKYKITTPIEVATFLSQCGHESLDFTNLEENLNYSATALKRMWPKRFPDDVTATLYARHPEKIANKIYANRMGNGNEASGDGWKYRGRGAIQLTGKTNIKAFAKYKGMDETTTLSYLTSIAGAVDSACWFFQNNNLIQLSHNKNVQQITKIINGGIIGIEDRKIRFDRCFTSISS